MGQPIDNTMRSPATLPNVDGYEVTDEQPANTETQLSGGNVDYFEYFTDPKIPWYKRAIAGAALPLSPLFLLTGCGTSSNTADLPEKVTNVSVNELEGKEPFFLGKNILAAYGTELQNQPEKIRLTISAVYENNRTLENCQGPNSGINRAYHIEIVEQWLRELETVPELKKFVAEERAFLETQK